MTKLMKDVFKLPVRIDIHDGNNMLVESDGARCADFVTTDLGIATAKAINNYDTLTEQNKQLVEALMDISNMCIGEVAMGYKLDAQSVGEIIYKATGKTNPELNELVAKRKEQI